MEGIEGMYRVVARDGKRLLKTAWQQHLLPPWGGPTGNCLVVRLTLWLEIVLEATCPRALT